jgi:hypothetical protein
MDEAMPLEDRSEDVAPDGNDDDQDEDEGAPREDLDPMSSVPLHDANDMPEPWSPVSEDAPAPHPYVGVAEAAADPLGATETDSVLGAAPTPYPEDLPPADEPPPAPMMQMVDEATDDLDHVHDQPLLGHSDLVSHVRDYHGEIATDGSTIQLRLLHERAHGAPHETPPRIRPS